MHARHAAGRDFLFMSRTQPRQPSKHMSPAPKTEPNSPPLRYLCVVDVEATCEEGDFRAVDHEIIELPVVLLDLQPAGGGVPSVVDHFHSFVRPTERPRLSDFCTGLTGVTQAQVDAAPTLPQVLDAVHAWLASRGLLLSFPSILSLPTIVRYSALLATALRTSTRRHNILLRKSTRDPLHPPLNTTLPSPSS